MNLLIHDIASAIEREASDDPPTDEFELTTDAVTVEVARIDAMRRAAVRAPRPGRQSDHHA